MIVLAAIVVLVLVWFCCAEIYYERDWPRDFLPKLLLAVAAFVLLALAR